MSNQISNIMLEFLKKNYKEMCGYEIGCHREVFSDNIRTNKGTVAIRWVGSSNGYYSERVDFKIIKLDKASLLT